MLKLVKTSILAREEFPGLKSIRRCKKWLRRF